MRLVKPLLALAIVGALAMMWTGREPVLAAYRSSDAEPEACADLRFLNPDPHLPLEGAFKVPGLRELARTAPYFHDGSKSTLRAVAGDLARSHDNVDYFPSYEIISSFPFKGMFYEPNLRSVDSAGVDHVMTQFFAGFGHTGSTDKSAPSVAESDRTQHESAAAGSDDLVCEEEVLDFYRAR